MKRERGFSLIELLVVIGIIAILIGILLPTMRGVRERAKAVTCASQLRQLGQAFYNYAAQNNGALPPWSGWHSLVDTGDDQEGPAWTEIIAPWYVPADSKVYNCPSVPEDFPNNYFLSSRWLAQSGRQNLVLTQVKSSSQFILSGDCTGEMLYPEPFGSSWHTSIDIDHDDATDPCLAFAADSPGLNVHHGGNNVLFGDGHVAWFRKFDSHEMTFHPSKAQAWDEVTGD